jgi:hypothetical protein
VGEIGTFIGDIWDAILGVLAIFLIPDWDLLIGLLPVLLLLGVLGPVLTLLMLGWAWHWMTRRRGRVRIADMEPVAGERDAAGALIVGDNVPFCSRDGLIYPPNISVCEICREELSVRCPVDGTTRSARQQLCRSCGTKYVLGASSSLITVRRKAGPPPGGAAVA